MSPLGLPSPIQGLGSGSTDSAIIGTGDSVPPGVESVIEYNGLFMNDRRLIDTYLVTNIGGLEDADIRDDRENNPQADGETAFDSYYGGRTITLSGKIRAFNLHKLRDMQVALKQAFAPLDGERSLVFHRPDRPEASCLVYCRKNAPMQMTEEQTTENHFERAFQITLRASNFRFLSLFNEYQSFEFGVVDDFAEDSSASYDSEEAGTWEISSGTLNSTAVSRKRLIRNDLDYLTADNEVVIKYVPDATFTSSGIRGVVKSIDADNFLYGQIDASGVLTIKQELAGVDSVVSGISYGTGGSTAPARTTGTPYWLRVRSSGNTITVEHFLTDPRIPGSTASRIGTILLSGGDGVQWGTGVKGRTGVDWYPGSTSWVIDDVSMGAYNLISEDLAEVVNMGNYKAEPVFTFRGGMNSVVLTNSDTGEQISLEENIDQDDYFVLDIANSTMKDSDGENKFNALGVASDWMRLAPGYNSLVMSATGLKPNASGGSWTYPSLSVLYRHAHL